MKFNLNFLKRSDKPVEAPNLNLEIERGHQAEVLLKSAAFERAWQRVRQGVHERWAQSPIADKDGQHELRLLIKVMDDVEANLHQEMQSGLLAQAQLRREQDLAQAKKDRENRPHIRSI